MRHAARQAPVVAVTGASAGVGRATARAFAAAGADVGLLARGSEGLHAARREVEAEGRRALVAEVDVADADGVEAAAARIEAELGPIDVWVNDAMVTVMSEVRDCTAEEFRRVTDVTYLGTVHGTLAALRRMLPRDRGAIVQVGSGLSYRAIPLQGAYCAAKHAVRGFTDSLRTELLHRKSRVHVTMVQLPGLNTPQFDWARTRFRHHAQPVPPIYQPEVAARAIVFAAGARRREVWVGGKNAMVILANKIAPWFADRYLARNGYGAQFTDEPVSPDRADNLHRPRPGDWGSRGAFDHRARGRSTQQWLSRNRTRLAVAGGAAALAVAASALRGKR